MQVSKPILRDGVRISQGFLLPLVFMLDYGFIVIIIYTILFVLLIDTTYFIYIGALNIEI